MRTTSKWLGAAILTTLLVGCAQEPVTPEPQPVAVQTTRAPGTMPMGCGDRLGQALFGEPDQVASSGAMLLQTADAKD